ncbi:MAG TPA: hypothetical protein VGL23_22330, partial [Chloroflexota bacterium]
MRVSNAPVQNNARAGLGATVRTTAETASAPTAGRGTTVAFPTAEEMSTDPARSARDPERFARARAQMPSSTIQAA